MTGDEQTSALRRAVQQLVRYSGALASESTPCGKPLSIAHAHALMTLLDSRELSQQELARALNIDKSNVTRLCAKMVEAGHALQRQNEQDGRSRMVSLTPRGKRLAGEVDAASLARFEELVAFLPKGRRHELIAALQEMVAAMQATCAPLEARREGGTTR